jgi:hypothetical protein
MAMPPPTPDEVAAEAARRYLAAFQQLVTLTSAGPLAVIGIYQIISGDSCGICQLMSEDSQSGLSFSYAQSLFTAVIALVTFISSLLLAAWGLLDVAQRDVLGGPLSPEAFFEALTARFIHSMILFVVGILLAFALILFSI